MKANPTPMGGVRLIALADCSNDFSVICKELAHVGQLGAGGQLIPIDQGFTRTIGFVQHFMNRKRHAAAGALVLEEADPHFTSQQRERHSLTYFGIQSRKARA